MHIQITGIDCCGKGTILDTWSKYLFGKEKNILDLRKVEKESHRIIRYKNFSYADVLLVAEPSFAWVGEAIRDEVIKNNGRHYSGLSTAWAFALAREILYHRVLIPARADEKIILQERCVACSMVYQPVQDDSVSLETILKMPGNRLALENPPDFLVIAEVEPETAIKRIMERANKQDDAIFEKLPFLQKIDARYHSKWLREIFENVGTKVVFLDTNCVLEETKRRAEKFFKKILV